ncbi:MAG: type II toxin-antitoxin system PemK/MazF family toxin [Selenomonadaceae bacterium]|nr:type II toxin-antitoxin system PemK/MazF family toxin [Selenomonadaceae bacterium]
MGIRRMDIWFADLPMKKDSRVQGGSRPVVIVSNDICNEVNSIVTVAPMTRQMKRLALPTHAVILAPDGGRSIVLAEQIMTIDKARLGNRMGRVREEDFPVVEAAIRDQLGMGGENEQHHHM